MMVRRQPIEALTETLRVSVATLRRAGVPFVVGGSVAAWARGGPEPQNDLDLMVRPADAEAALAALEAAGMRIERPPEEWLDKAWNGDVMIDVIYQPSGLEMNDEVFARADMLTVMAVETPVMALEDVLSTKLHALKEHQLDYTALLRIARSVREQIDWRSLRARTAGAPLAKAFFTLVEELDIAPPAGAGAVPAKTHTAAGSRVRVLPSGG